MKLLSLVIWATLGLFIDASHAAPLQKGTDYAADIEFALDALEERCGHFFDQKGVQWKKVRSEFTKAAKAVTSDEAHFELLVRLLARLRDGHARVQPTEANADFVYPKDLFPEVEGPGLFWCRVGKRYYVRNAMGNGAELGFRPGMEILKVNGTKVDAWVKKRQAELSELISFSTDQQAEFYTLSWGLAHPKNTPLKLELKDLDGKKLQRTAPCVERSYTPEGPVNYPAQVETTKDLRYALLEDGVGYVHVCRCKGDLPEQMDVALAALHAAKGWILDFRGNSGGGFDHDDLMGRFVPQGKVFDAGVKRFASTGEQPFGGPIVVLVDGTVRSAGETGAGMFQEDGRGYMIGESATAGMSSQKETIALPSRKFELYVSVMSNKARYQGGKGIEGLGIQPAEIVALDPKDLAEGRDTLIERARKLLSDFPQSKVPYRPEAFGWKPETR